MANWTKEELAAIAKDKNLYISIPNADGSMHKPTWIWAVVAGDDLFARGYNGVDSRWYVAAKATGHGHVSIGGVERNVTFKFPTDKATNDLVDAGYATKYAGSKFLEEMQDERRRAATIKLLPRAS